MNNTMHCLQVTEGLANMVEKLVPEAKRTKLMQQVSAYRAQYGIFGRTMCQVEAHELVCLPCTASSVGTAG